MLWLAHTEIHEHRVLGLVAVDAPEIAGVERQGGVPFPNDPLPAVEAYEIQPRFAAHAAGAGGLGAGYPLRVVDSRSLRPSEDLNKSFCVCSGDRKYFSGASGIKIADKEHPFP